jgi:hypothetical protein
MMIMERCMKIVTKCYAMPGPASLKGEEGDVMKRGNISRKGCIEIDRSEYGER